jgi:hypothetical protein
LTNDPAACRAERLTDGNFTKAAGAANEEQIRDIGAHNQEHDRNGDNE